MSKRFQVEEEEIGAGTFGIVSKARDKKHDRLVALKKVIVENDEEGIPNNTIKETSLLQRLKHKNIVKLYEVYVENVDIYLVFELMDRDLKKYIDHKKTREDSGLDPKLVKHFMRQLLSGVKFIHRNGVLHRDLKPQNLLINARYDLKIGDFGLARGFGIPVRSFTNSVVTLWYRPPCVLLGNTDYSTPLDLWSVGCIFSELATGRALFQGGDQESQLTSIFQRLKIPKSIDYPDLRSFINWSTEYEFIDQVDLLPEETVSRLGEDAENLLRKLLKINPKLRISARRAHEQHSYFTFNQ